MPEQLPDQTRCIVTWRGGLTIEGVLHENGAVFDAPSGFALYLRDRGQVRLMPWLARRPHRRGEAAHDPTEVIEERPWWLADELADLLPPPPPVRQVSRVRVVGARLSRRRTY